MKLNTQAELRETRSRDTLQQSLLLQQGAELSLTQTEREAPPDCGRILAIMVKEEEIMAEAAGGRGYIDLLGLGPLEDLLCLSPSSYFTSSVVSATTTSATATDTAAAAAASSPTCASYLNPAYHHMLSFAGPEQYHGDGGGFGFQYYGGDHAIPAAVPQKSSPTTECSSSISSMSSSPPATAISAVSCSKPQAFKKKVSRSSDRRKAASAAAAPANAPAAGATTNKKRPRVRKERLGERIMALQQLVSPFGKSDTASVLHEALGYIRFLHDQVQVLSSPYMQRQPASAAHVAAPESAAGTVVEVEPPRPSDLRSRGLCLMPVHCTDHIPGNSHGNGNGADLWSVAAGMAKAAADNKGAAGGMLLPGGGGGHPRQGHLA